jgi:hypothetical protein
MLHDSFKYLALCHISVFLVNDFSNLSSSFNKGGNLQSHTVKGFDASLVENKVIFSRSYLFVAYIPAQDCMKISLFHNFIVKLVFLSVNIVFVWI